MYVWLADKSSSERIQGRFDLYGTTTTAINLPPTMRVSSKYFPFHNDPQKMSSWFVWCSSDLRADRPQGPVLVGLVPTRPLFNATYRLQPRLESLEIRVVLRDPTRLQNILNETLQNTLNETIQYLLSLRSLVADESYRWRWRLMRTPILSI